ncbi:MAG: acetyl-CoA C-acetyltransferase [Actinobacteria bacterium]|nr:acetyl-CoA C-acetyltransferase [Actinomycetota bacterium]
MADNDVVILSAVRTAQGRMLGGLKDTPAIDLGALVIKEAMARANVQGAQLDEVIMGNVITAGLGQCPARQAAIKAGVPDDVPAYTVNRVCVSGAVAIAAGANAIKAGDQSLLVVGGMENMTRGPWVLQNGRTGYRMGLPTDKIYDATVYDGLWCAFNDYHMGITAENLSAKFGVTREDQDRLAYESHTKAWAATESGRFKDEIVPVIIPQRKGEPLVVEADESIRKDASLEAMAKMKPFFKADGCVTAGNACPINDGASALVIASRAKAKELGAKPLATIVANAAGACDPAIMGYGETVAGQKCLEKAGIKAADIGLVELNEAFAVVAEVAIRELKVDRDKVNVNGGAVAIGHPLGSTGSRLVVTMLHEMMKRGVELGMTAACVGGGQGAATIIRLEA